jgi:hypothetical protein
MFETYLLGSMILGMGGGLIAVFVMTSMHE